MTLDNTDSPWVQVEFDFPVEIHSVAVAGHQQFFGIFNEYIVNYYIQYRPVEGVLQFVMDNATHIPQVHTFNLITRHEKKRQMCFLAVFNSSIK